MSTGDRDRVIMAEVIAKVWSDPAYEAKLKAHPAETLEEAGLDLKGHKVDLLMNRDNITYVVLPAEGGFDAVKISFLKFLEQNVPLGDREIRVVQNTQDTIHIVIPLKPAKYGSGAVSDEELAAISGGGSSAANVDTGVNAQVAGNVEVVTNGGVAQNVAGATEGVVVAVGGAVLT